MGSSEVTAERPFTKTALHALGNVFLGVAAGLLMYYLVTDAVGRWRQAELRDELSALGAVGAPSPDRLVPEEPVDEAPRSVWDTWRAEDVGYWAALEPDGVFGRLVIEKMELDSVVVRGVGTEDLKRGPGWMPYTDIPGPTGNVGIAAHRTTYGAPFRRLDELVPGDTVYFFSPYRRYTYVVTEKFTVTPDRTEVVETTEESMLTLSACHPPYSARYRLIVQAELTEVHTIGRTEETSE
ncbi:MAG: class E sortase [Clostridiales bacterium]|nr:class E sortase [Clostridiales bacterium]